MSDRDDVLRKIRALLLKTVANGCPVEEALAAHAKVRKLIDEYQVSHEELYANRARRQQRAEPEPERATEGTEQAYSHHANDLAFRNRNINAVTFCIFLAAVVAGFIFLPIRLTPNLLPLTTVDDYADNVLAQQISQVPAVAQVSTGGEPPAISSRAPQLEQQQVQTSTTSVSDGRGVVRLPASPGASSTTEVASTTASPPQTKEAASTIPTPSQTKEAASTTASPSQTKEAAFAPPKPILSERIFSPDEINRMVSRGEAFLAQGNVSAARIVLIKAAAARNPRAALALGATYDPRVLQRMGLFGIRPDPEKARFWYERAAEFGWGEEGARRAKTERIDAAAIQPTATTELPATMLGPWGAPNELEEMERVPEDQAVIYVAKEGFDAQNLACEIKEVTKHTETVFYVRARCESGHYREDLMWEFELLGRKLRINDIGMKKSVRNVR